MNDIREQLLFDYYGDLLTPKQREILSYYFDSDYSLAEIAQILGISRQSVYDSIHRSLKALETYEDKLGMIDSDEKRRKDLKELERSVRALGKNDQTGRILKILKRMIEENGI